MCRQCISSTPAPNQASHSEKSISVHDQSLLLWNNLPLPDESSTQRHPIVVQYLDISEECLGGDVDYTERIASLAVNAASNFDSSLPATPMDRSKMGDGVQASGSVSRSISKKGGKGKKRPADGGAGSSSTAKIRKSTGSTTGGGVHLSTPSKSKKKGGKGPRVGGGTKEKNPKRQRIIREDGRGDTTSESEDDNDGSDSDFL